MTGFASQARLVAILLTADAAAGPHRGRSGSTGDPPPPELAELAGSPVIEHSIAVLDACPEVHEIVVTASPGHVAEVERLVAARPYQKVTRALEAGPSRVASLRRALAALEPDGRLGPDGTGRARMDAAGTAGDTRVLVHDAMRPLVERQLVTACIRAMHAHEAVTMTEPASDTVLAVEGPAISGVPARDSLAHLQTPQGFRLAALRQACAPARDDEARAGDSATGDPDDPDDPAALILRRLPRVPLHVAPGSESNITIAHPGDINLAEALLEARQRSAAGHTPNSRE